METRIVPNETIPARLFACFAGVSPEAGAALNLWVLDPGVLDCEG